MVYINIKLIKKREFGKTNYNNNELYLPREADAFENMDRSDPLRSP